MLIFGRYFEVDAWSRFCRWNLIKICVRTTQVSGPLWLRQCFIRKYVPIMCIWQLKLILISIQGHPPWINKSCKYWSLGSSSSVSPPCCWSNSGYLLRIGLRRRWSRWGAFDQKGISRCSWWSNYLKTSLLSEDSPQTSEIYKTYI